MRFTSIYMTYKIILNKITFSYKKMPNLMKIKLEMEK